VFKKTVVILGGGVGGLAAGWMLARTRKYDVTIVERGSVTGGLCATFQYGNFRLDHGPHKSYSVIPGILDELRALLGEEFLKHKKKHSIYLFGSYLRYPVRMSDLIMKMGMSNLIQSGLDFATSILKRMWSGKRKIESYEDYMLSRFGNKLYQLVFEPLAEKVWGDPSTLSAEIARTRVPSTSIVDVTLRAVGLKNETALTDAEYFYYPRGGFGRIPERMEEEVHNYGGAVWTNTRPLSIWTNGPKITYVEVEKDGERVTLPCDLLISAIPHDALIDILDGGNTAIVREASQTAKTLQFRALFLVYVFVDARQLTEEHWIFYPGHEVIFGRIFEQKMLSPGMCPENKTVICCDFTDCEGGVLWKQSDDELAKRCVEDLRKVGILGEARVEGTLVRRFPKFYPRYDVEYKQTISTLYNSLKFYENLLCTGRVGFYNYNNSDHCTDMGKFIAEGLQNGRAARDIWSDLERRVADYQIID
jgi:protoporphyrinogen oxidase